MKVTMTGRKANKAKKDGRYIMDAVREDGRHILVGGLPFEPKKGDVLQIEGDTFKMPQDAIWATDGKVLQPASAPTA